MLPENLMVTIPYPVLLHEFTRTATNNPLKKNARLLRHLWIPKKFLPKEITIETKFVNSRYLYPFHLQVVVNRVFVPRRWRFHLCDITTHLTMLRLSTRISTKSFVDEREDVLRWERGHRPFILKDNFLQNPLHWTAPYIGFTWNLPIQQHSEKILQSLGIDRS